MSYYTIPQIIIHQKIEEKLLRKHGVTRREVEQCFDNALYDSVEDTRARHKTKPPTLWFIAETNKGRALKIAYVPYGESIYIKTAYEPNAIETQLFDRIKVSK